MSTVVGLTLLQAAACSCIASLSFAMHSRQVLLKLRGGGASAAALEHHADLNAPSIFYVHEGLARCSVEHMSTRLVESPSWRELRRCAKIDDRVAEGAAAEHTAAARDEAASKLIANHLTCVLDMTNPYPRSQLHLTRLPVSGQTDADDALREVARRLIGTRTDVLTTEAAPATREAAEMWVRALTYLEKRLQVSRAELPERARDMSPEAGAALRAVLQEVASLNTVISLRGGATQSQLVLSLGQIVPLGSPSPPRPPFLLPTASYSTMGTVAPKALF